MEQVYNKTNKKSLMVLLIIVTLFAEPLVSFHFLFDYTAIIDYLIIFMLLLYAHSKKNRNKRLKPIAKYAIIAFVFVVIKSLLIDGTSEVLGANIGLYMKSFFALIYLYICYILFEERKLIFTFSVWSNFLFWICICTVITLTLYRLGFHYLFIKKQVINYPCEQIPFIGLLHYDDNAKIRPSWFFCEPSALGSVLGFNMLMVCRYYWNQRQKLKILVYLLAFIFCGSMTGVFCAAFAFSMNFILSTIKFIGKFSLVIKIVMIALIPTAITLFTTFDSRDLTNRDNTFSGSSLLTRQERTLYGVEKVASASTTQLILGRGENYNDFGKGVSNYYLHILCANGAIILVLYISILVVLLKNTNYEFYYLLMALNSVNSLITPFFMLMMIIAHFYYKNRLNLTVPFTDGYKKNRITN